MKDQFRNYLLLFIDFSLPDHHHYLPFYNLNYYNIEDYVKIKIELKSELN
jgi:hypothetical protein